VKIKSSWYIFFFWCVPQLWTLAKSPYSSNYLFNWHWLLRDTCFPPLQVVPRHARQVFSDFQRCSIKRYSEASVISVLGRNSEPALVLSDTITRHAILLTMLTRHTSWYRFMVCLLFLSLRLLYHQYFVFFSTFFSYTVVTLRLVGEEFVVFFLWELTDLVTLPILCRR
jgi:hypothetical protein